MLLENKCIPMSIVVILVISNDSVANTKIKAAKFNLYLTEEEFEVPGNCNESVWTGLPV